MSVSDSTDPTDAVIDILVASDTSEWTFSKPGIKRYEDISVKGRENTQSDTVYVHSPTELSLDRFSAEPADQTEEGNAQILIYSLVENRAREHARDVVEIIRQYMNDNYDSTEFHNIEPTAIVDNRAQKVARQTDHFVYAVDIEMERLV